MKYILTFVIAGILFSCAKVNNTVGSTNQDQFLFGSSYGFCMGKCGANYAIIGDKLYFDTSSKREDYKLAVQTSAKYDIAKVLLAVPNYMKARPNETFGCPDCADQGRLYVSLIAGKDTTTWSIDTRTESLPKEVNIYANQLINVLEELKKQ